MKQIEKYYNEQIKQKGDPGFKDLSEDDKRSIGKSAGFAFYIFEAAFGGLVLAWNDFGKALKKAGFK